MSWLLLFTMVVLNTRAQVSSTVEPWRPHVSAAAAYEQSGDVSQAETELKRAAADAVRGGGDGPAYAQVLYATGAFYDDIGDFAQAERALCRSLRLWRKLRGAQDLASAPVVNRLASLYLELGEVQVAERLDLEGWARLLEADWPGSLDLVHMLQNLAILRSWNGRFAESEMLFEKALALLPADSLAERAILQNNLGIACLRTKHQEGAVEHLRASLELWEQLRGPDDRNTGLSCHSLAIAYQAVGNTEEVEPLLKRALRIAEKQFGENSARTAAILQTYSEFLRKAKRKAEAKVMEARSKKIMASARVSSTEVVDVSERGLRGGR